jgi:MFS family permease
MSFEHSPDHRRGFFTSFTLSGTQGGQILAPAVFLPLAAVLSDDQLQSWGWRIPFWISAVVVVVGLVIRRRLEETPEFRAEVAEHDTPKTPLAVLFRDHWRGVLRVFFAAFIATVNTIFAVFALNLATSDDYGIGISKTVMLWLAIVANIVAVAIIPCWATLSDRVGRKPIFITGVLGSAVLVVAFLGAIANGQVALMFILGVALAGVVYSMPNAVWPATYAEYFPTSVRLSGMAVGTQFGFALAGFAPTIAGALIGGEASNWVRPALFTAGACVISAIAVATGPRATHRLPMSEVGRRGGRLPDSASASSQDGEQRTRVSGSQSPA